MLSARKAADIHRDLRRHDFGGAATDTRDAVQQHHGVLIRLQTLAKLLANAANRFIQVIDVAEHLSQQKAVVRCQVSCCTIPSLAVDPGEHGQQARRQCRSGASPAS